jgi:hypothetical protein
MAAHDRNRPLVLDRVCAKRGQTPEGLSGGVGIAMASSPALACPASPMRLVVRRRRRFGASRTRKPFHGRRSSMGCVSFG